MYDTSMNPIQTSETLLIYSQSYHLSRAAQETKGNAFWIQRRIILTKTGTVRRKYNDAILPWMSFLHTVTQKTRQIKLLVLRFYSHHLDHELVWQTNNINMFVDLFLYRYNKLLCILLINNLPSLTHIFQEFRLVSFLCFTFVTSWYLRSFHFLFTLL